LASGGGLGKCQWAEVQPEQPGPGGDRPPRAGGRERSADLEADHARADGAASGQGSQRLAALRLPGARRVVPGVRHGAACGGRCAQALCGASILRAAVGVLRAGRGLRAGCG